jgi:molecular chaperone Hsp33
VPVVTESDSLRRFLFEDAPLRGHWVRLTDTWRDAREHQHLPTAVMKLLGEALAAVSLLAGSLKFSGSLTLQLRGGSGKVSMLIAQATRDLTVRGVAHIDETVSGEMDDFNSLMGEGQLVITVEQGSSGAPPWQGIVPLDRGSLAASLEQYFENSEQVPTRIMLGADEHQACGLLLQKLPTPTAQGEAGEARVLDVWEEASALLLTVKEDELLASEPRDLLESVFARHDLRLFDAESVRFACRCSKERVASMLRSLGKEEIESILAEQGSITVTCEFCRRPYVFDAVDAAQLVADTPVAPAPDSLN